MTQEFLYQFMRKCRYAIAATVAPGNMPEAALVGIAVTRDLEVIFDTSMDSRKYQNLLINPFIALVIGWENEQTLQLEGVIRFPKEPELKKLKPLYFASFPDGRERAGRPEIGYVLIQPKWIRFSDYQISQMEEMTF